MNEALKRVIVFGGTSGIGLATARLLHERGSSVAVVSNDKLGLSQLPDAIIPIVADVSIEKEIAKGVRDAVQQLGGVDGMVYSAGIQRYGTVVSTETDEWDLVLNINVRGAFLAAKHVMPHLIAHGRGAIVNVSSVQAIACQSGVVAYAASKGGLNALTRGMALDHAAEGIRVNVVCPGSVDTPMLRVSADLFGAGRDTQAVLSEWGQSHALGRVAAANEIAEVIAFLLSDRASFVTGSEIVVDGGLTAALAVTTRASSSDRNHRL